MCALFLSDNPDNQDGCEVTEWAGSLSSVDILVKGMIHVRGQMEQDSVRDFFKPPRTPCNLIPPLNWSLMCCITFWSSKLHILQRPHKVTL